MIQLMDEYLKCPLPENLRTILSDTQSDVSQGAVLDHEVIDRKVVAEEYLANTNYESMDDDTLKFFL